MSERAKAERKEKIAKANRDYAEEMRHIKWLRGRMVPNRAAQPSLTVPHNDGEGSPATNGNNGDSLMAAIKSAAIDAPQFTADYVVQWMKKERPEIDVSSDGRLLAICRNLSRMNGGGLLETVERGKRGKLQVYKATDRLRELEKNHG
jgi:hypothetical protein